MKEMRYVLSIALMISLLLVHGLPMVVAQEEGGDYSSDSGSNRNDGDNRWSDSGSDLSDSNSDLSEDDTSGSSNVANESEVQAAEVSDTTVEEDKGDLPVEQLMMSADISPKEAADMRAFEANSKPIDQTPAIISQVQLAPQGFFGNLLGSPGNLPGGQAGGALGGLLGNLGGQANSKPIDQTPAIISQGLFLPGSINVPQGFRDNLLGPFKASSSPLGSIGNPEGQLAPQGVFGNFLGIGGIMGNIGSYLPQNYP